MPTVHFRIRAVASALAISPESLEEVPVESSRQALELLFGLSDEFGMEPIEADGMLMLGFGTKNVIEGFLNDVEMLAADMADCYRETHGRGGHRHR